MTSVGDAFNLVVLLLLLLLLWNATLVAVGLRIVENPDTAVGADVANTPSIDPIMEL